MSEVLDTPLKRAIDRWFLSFQTKSDDFPVSEYRTNCLYFVKALADVYKTLELSALLKGYDPEEELMCLNDHGEDHVRVVIIRAKELIDLIKYEKLTPYEAYILLVSILIHDIGVRHGRKNHESKAREVIMSLNLNIGDDKIERECIFDIAWAHGGEEKDKITRFSDDMILGNKVRKRMLSAILKLADELSDGRFRCSKDLLKSGALPEGSKIYHQFSYSLHSVSISGDTILFAFELDENDTKKMFKKKGKSIFLLDEIYERTFKTHLERMYCNRFLTPEINIHQIKVSICIWLNALNENLKNIEHSISYSLGSEIGYPDIDPNDIFRICPHLLDETGAKIKEKFKEG